ncbi:hypothetical protein NBRC10513v2_004935 [Rhodotorula toruloides]|uniref:Uncharacterized protein n=1 Tax=Rhodotorula toruloides TaxID=5286 RepID=A0A0K3C718_RHOTO|nr:hypothetical protein AAT19DRAFT_8727 [Rhodotorula toruloides]
MSSLMELGTYVAQQTAFLPALTGFSMAARGSLKTYLAAQALGPAPKVDDKDLKKLKWARCLMVLVLCGGIFGLEFWLISQQDMKKLDIFFRYLNAFVYQSALTGTLLDMTKSLKWAAFRSPGNVLHFRPAPGTVSFPRVLTAVALATGLNAATYFDLNWAFGSFLTVALLYRSLSSPFRRVFSLRVMMLCMIAWLALTFLLSGLVILYVANYWMDGAAGDGTLDSSITGVSDTSSITSTEVTRYMNLILPFAFSVFPGVLAVGCYRFDYANHVEANPELAAAVTLETCEPRKRFAKILSQGVVLPEKGPSGFLTPYFTTALWSWILAYVATFGLFAAAIPLPKDVLTNGAFDMTALTLAIPFMIVGLVITASIRGEFRRIWKHKEVWSPKEDEAEGAIALPEDDVEAPLYAEVADEKHPEIPDVVIEYAEPAPAYDAPSKQ